MADGNQPRGNGGQSIEERIFELEIKGVAFETMILALIRFSPASVTHRASHPQLIGGPKKAGRSEK